MFVVDCIWTWITHNILTVCFWLRRGRQQRWDRFTDFSAPKASASMYTKRKKLEPISRWWSKVVLWTLTEDPPINQTTDVCLQRNPLESTRCAGLPRIDIEITTSSCQLQLSTTRCTPPNSPCIPFSHQASLSSCTPYPAWAPLSPLVPSV